jgi:hypothetical protein
MDEPTLAEWLTSIEANNQRVNEAIKGFIASMDYYKEDPETALWKLDNAELINTMQCWAAQKIEIWTREIIDQVKFTDAFSPEFIKTINGISFNLDKGETPES